jgi:GNAT superfamily N-acetyltransferase
MEMRAPSLERYCSSAYSVRRRGTVNERRFLKRLVTKMELLLAREWTKLRRMGNAVRNMEIWRARLEEADAAFGLVQEYFEVARVVAREDQERFVEEYFGQGRGFWMARLDDELSGCVGLRNLPRPEELGSADVKCAEIKRMYVREKFRGRGVAERLLAAAENFAREEGYAWIYLDTASEMVAAARLYERNGYERCGRYNENPQAAIFMRKSL